MPCSKVAVKQLQGWIGKGATLVFNNVPNRYPKSSPVEVGAFWGRNRGFTTTLLNNSNTPARAVLLVNFENSVFDISLTLDERPVRASFCEHDDGKEFCAPINKLYPFSCIPDHPRLFFLLGELILRQKLTLELNYKGVGEIYYAPIPKR